MFTSNTRMEKNISSVIVTWIQVSDGLVWVFQKLMIFYHFYTYYYRQCTHKYWLHNQTGLSWHEAYGNSNNLSLPPWWTERHLRLHILNMKRQGYKNQFHLCQSRIGIWSLSDHRHNETLHLSHGKMLPRLFQPSAVQFWLTLSLL